MHNRSNGGGSYRVFAWPDWGSRDEVGWILREFGSALTEVGGCICLRHDSELDGPVQAAETRLAELRARHPAETMLIADPLTDPEWEVLAGTMDARISRNVWPNSPRQKRLDQMQVLELRTKADVPRLLAAEPQISPFDRFRSFFAGVPGWFQMPASAIWDSLLTAQSE